MKYIKLFENNEGEFISNNSSLKYLPPDKLKESTEIFEDLLEPLIYPFIDKGYEITFTTAYGSSVSMSYQDYLDKTIKWHIFINGFPIRGYFITIKILINEFNPLLLSDILKNGYDEYIEKLPNMWKHLRTEIKMFDKYSVGKPRTFIEIELDARN